MSMTEIHGEPWRVAFGRLRMSVRNYHYLLFHCHRGQTEDLGRGSGA